MKHSEQSTNKRKGIILAGGSGTRLYPLTMSVSKQLMPIYDKPMIYYPLSIFMLMGIREILVITTPHDKPLFQRLLSNGQQWGIELTYATQAEPNGLAEAFIIGEEFLQEDPAALILGDNLFYGDRLVDSLKKANENTEKATIFGYPVDNPEDFGVVDFDKDGNVLSIEEKPKKPKSDYAIPGIYFYDSRVCKIAKSLSPSQRGELEITDLNNYYLNEDCLNVELLSRGIAWLDTGTHDALVDATAYVRVIEKRQGTKIACLEEIAYRNGWISPAQLRSIIKQMKQNNYGKYLQRLLNLHELEMAA